MATKRNMTVDGFLLKTRQKGANSAAAFLAAHREWLTTGTLAEFTTPILAKLDKGEILPTPTLEEIKKVVVTHHILSMEKKGQEAMEKASEPKEPKAYVATIFDASGNVPEVWQEKVNPETGKDEGGHVPLVKDFDLPQRAEGWLERKLFDGAPDWHGEVASMAALKQDGTSIITRVERKDAIANILRRGRTPVCHKKAVSTSRLGFGVKSNPSRNVKSGMG